MSFGERPPSYREQQPGPPQWNGPPPTGTPFGAPLSWQAPKKNDLPMWAVGVIVACMGSCVLFATCQAVRDEKVRAAQAAEVARLAAEDARRAAGQLAAFEPRRAEYERLATTAREHNSATQLAGLAGIVRPFDPALATRLQTEADLFRYADACAAQQEVTCATLVAALAPAGYLPPAAVTRVRETCGLRLAGQHQARIAALGGLPLMSVDGLREVRATAACIETMTARATWPSVATLDDAIAARTAVVPARTPEPPGPLLLPTPPSEPFRYTGGGGYGGGGYGGGRGGGRCRDSRGRFTRCY